MRGLCDVTDFPMINALYLALFCFLGEVGMHQVLNQMMFKYQEGWEANRNMHRLKGSKTATSRKSQIMKKKGGMINRVHYKRGLHAIGNHFKGYLVMMYRRVIL